MKKTIDMAEGLHLPAATAAAQVYAFMGRRLPVHKVVDT
jgi:hypothetical protein